MMKEKLIIDNFGGIEHLEIEIGGINILVGPQASGKSIIAKLFFYFKSFLSATPFLFDSTVSQKDIETKQEKTFLRYFPKSAWPTGPFSIRYETNESWLKIKKGSRGMPGFSCSASIWEMIREGQKTFLGKIKGDADTNLMIREREDTGYFKNTRTFLEKKISGNAGFEQYFVPAGRSFFSIMRENIFTLLRADIEIDPFLKEFGFLYERVKKTFDAPLKKINKNARQKSDQLITRILNSDFIQQGEREFLLHKDNRKVSLESASSGQQEILPLIVIIKAFLNNPFSVNGSTLYIEEPEAHLFPNSQKNIVQLLARVVNAREDDVQIFITTHSPYILSALNNLMYAGYLKNKHSSSSDPSKIIPVKEMVNPGDVCAYAITKDGKISDIVDKDSGLISGNALDDISNEISVEFGKLLDIEYDA